MKSSIPGQGDDQISVLHSQEEDSPRRNSDKDESDLPDVGADPEFLDGEKDESAGLAGSAKPAPTDAPLDISPSSIVDEEDIGAAIRSDEATLARYEREAKVDRGAASA